jgi:hypothetical protein
MRWLRAICRGTRALLVELSDEGAYRRHLALSGREHSATEWRRFSDQRLRAKYLRPKCC